MSYTLRATSVLAKRRLAETLLSAGFYVVLTAGLLLEFVFVSAFVSSVNSAGFSYSATPLYGFIGRVLSGAFGTTFVDSLFAEGPFVFALYTSFLPVLTFLVVSSVFRYAFEKRGEAVELLAYGPVDSVSYFLASLIRDAVMSAVALLCLSAMLAVSGVANNMVLGGSFSYHVVLILFFSLCLSAYGILASSVTDNPASAITIFLGLALLFGVVMVGSITVISDQVRRAFDIVGLVVRWISPVYYWSLGLRQAVLGNWLLYGALLLLLTALSAGVFFVSIWVTKARGVWQ